MSAANNVASFKHPVWNVDFGPSLSLSQLILHGWMYGYRLHRENAGWQTQPSGASFLLASLNDLAVTVALGAILPQNTSGGWDYHLEYVRPTGWNRGVGKAALLIRRLTPSKSAYLGAVAVPSQVGATSAWTEPSGKVLFQVEKMEAEGRVVKVTARKI